MRNNHSALLFLLGLFAMTEIYVGGFAAISELVLFFVGPIVLLKNIRLLRKDGFMPMVWLLILTLFGCVIASRLNHTAFPSFIKGVSAIYATLCAFVCAHALLRDDFKKVKWFFVGYSLSLVINIFIFQRGSARHMGDVSIFSEAAMESTANSVLFWAGRLPNWLFTPVRGWYIETPFLYSILAAVLIIAVSLFGSGGSGRAAALAGMGTLCLLLVGRKTTRELVRLKKHMSMVVIFLILAAAGGKVAYQHLATEGALGEAGRKKLEEQTKRGDSAFSMIVAGRGEFFAGLYCALHKPIVGYGPWAIDHNGLAGDFLAKYGSYEDYDKYIKYQMAMASQTRIRQSVIPSHSCIVGFWTWYGIFGLTLWLYILWLYWKTFTTYFVAYPPWFGCVATILPLAVWDAFFSPYGNRVMTGLFFAICLFLKAVHGKKLPPGGVVHRYIPGGFR